MIAQRLEAGRPSKGLLLRRDGSSETAAAAPRRDSLELSTRKDPESVGEAAAQGAADGARIGGLVANIGIGGMLIYKGLKGVAKIPAGSLFGRVIPYVGIAFSALGTVNGVRNLVADFTAPKRETGPIVAHSLDLASNLLIGAGTIALVAGAVAAPWLVAIGAGFLLGAASGLLHKN